ncbi:isochorismatase family protein [Dactylosporangium roseum]|uniref:Isochorismatase family protein n=1 Tax=Dactylosporangium roseum TaxID=47989 RepID=A0ABY5ZCE8_9ACTN|nr:isochorismatase family protein [Dactylosporangium roseum]UWZ39241.1 isochorismatase family protein [Dactylosporangium roseum]
MAVWDEFVGDADKAIYERAGIGARVGRGSRPAVIIIDVTYSFCGPGPRRLPAADPGPADEVSAHHHGIDAWDAVRATADLLVEARASAVPVFYTAGIDYRADGRDAGRWRDKTPRLVSDSVRRTEAGDYSGNEIVAELRPSDGDFVIRKAKPSAFFGTPLQAYLTDHMVDTLLICGVTTSGCVRATVIDGFSHNYRVNVVEECVFDRCRPVHAMNLFDMDRKYADVTSVASTVEYLRSLRGGEHPADAS